MAVQAEGELVRLVTAILSLALLVHSQDYRLTYNVTEEQEPLTFVGNVALDTGFVNGDVRFEVFTQNQDNWAGLFSLDRTTGVIRTNRTINREAVCGQESDCSMILNMGAWQDGSLITIQVVIRVQDINDNAPEFPQHVVTLTVPENMPAPYKLYTSVAADSDKAGPNSNISYDFQTDSPDLFILELEGGGGGGSAPTDLVVKVNDVLDREARDRYYVTVVAADKGSPRQSGSVLITISVTDRNDNPPVFQAPNYTVSVNENAVRPEPILTVSAADRDIGDNGQVVYQLNPRSSQQVKSHFRVEQQSGEVFLTQKVDYETQASFAFQVDASDKGDPAQSSSTFVVVNIDDVNDNAPEIHLNLSPAGTDIVEHTAAGKFLGHISVTDKDLRDRDNIVCEISDPNFRLDPFEGQENVYKIVLAQPLDHEDLPRRQVTIRCRDNEQDPLEASKSFTVQVIDINDNSPVFTPTSFTGTVLENNPAGSTVMQQVLGGRTQTAGALRISATDLDSGEFGKVSYSLPERSNFTIDPVTGTLTTLISLDREAQDQYTLNVLASDQGEPAKTSTATVIVKVLDQNDHPPRFTRPIYTLNIRENMPPGSQCGRVSAVDEDTGVNAEVQYSIPRDSQDFRFFSVNGSTGEVSSNQEFDRETRSVYTFRLEVVNPSRPYYKDSTQVGVNVLDDNDHPPVITSPTPHNNTVVLPHNTTVGTTILTVTARDDDDPKDTQLEFTLPGSHSESLFHVLTAIGELILYREIKPADAGTHKVFVVVSDGGSPPLSSTATILVTIPADGMRAASGAGLLSEPNFIIIVVIVLVTLLVALLVVTVICCVFRRDKKRRAGRQQQRQVKDKMYHAAQWVSTHSLPPELNGSPVRDSRQQPQELDADRKGKKEVSFSLDEEAEKRGEDPDTSGSLGSVFMSHNSSENNNLKPGGDTRLITFIGGKSSPSSHSTPSCYESSDGHTYHSTPIAETNADDQMHMQLERPGGEDALSASSGETGTDSGRGGSEDEAHSNRGSSLDSADPRHFHPASAPTSNNNGYATFHTGPDRGRRKPPSLSSLPEERLHPHPHSQGAADHALHHPGNQPSYFRSSSEQLPTHHKNYPARNLSFAGKGLNGGSSSNGSGSSNQPLNKDDRSYYSMDRIERSGEGPFRIRDQGEQRGRRTFHTFGHQHPNPNSHPHPQQHPNQQAHPAWRRAKGLDGGWRANYPGGSHVTATDEDDRTTTSGSYTVGPEEAASDLEESGYPKMQDVMV